MTAGSDAIAAATAQGPGAQHGAEAVLSFRVPALRKMWLGARKTEWTHDGDDAAVADFATVTTVATFATVATVATVATIATVAAAAAAAAKCGARSACACTYGLYMHLRQYCTCTEFVSKNT